MTGLTTKRVEYSRPEASFDLALLPESTTEEPCRGQHDSSRLPSKRPCFSAKYSANKDLPTPEGPNTKSMLGETSADSSRFCYY